MTAITITAILSADFLSIIYWRVLLHVAIYESESENEVTFTGYCNVCIKKKKIFLHSQTSPKF